MVKIFFRQVHKNTQIVKFIIAGGTAALANFTLLYGLTETVGLWYIFSATIAFIISFFVSFYLQRHWTFEVQSHDRMYRQMYIYFIVAVINLVINDVAMYLAVEFLGMWYMLAQFIIYALLAGSSFLIYKYFIFNNVEPAVKLSQIKQNQGKVLIATGIYPPDLGGPATMLKDLVRSLGQRGFEVKVLTYADKASRGPQSEKETVYRVYRSFWQYPWFFWKMWEMSSWADVVYVTDIYSVGLFAYWLKKMTDKKYIIRFAGDSAWETAAGRGWTDDYISDFIEKKYDERIEILKHRRKKVLMGADKVIAVSNFMSGLAKKIGVLSSKISVVYNAIDFFTDQAKWQKPDNKTLVFAGRLVPWKGVAMLIQCVADLRKKHPEIKLEILGDGPQEIFLKKMVDELDVASHVSFRGRVSEEESHQIFAQSAVFVLNTNYEGLSHSILNAWRVGVPIITTMAGGNVELIKNKENGLVAPYNDKVAWVLAIDQILTDRSLGEKLSAGGRASLGRFKWQNTVAHTAQAIKETIG